MTSLLNGVSSSLPTGKGQLDSVMTDKLEYEVDGYAQRNDKGQDSVLPGQNSIVGYDGHCTNKVINMIKKFILGCSPDEPSFTYRLIEKLKSMDTRGSGATYTRMEVTRDGDLHVEWSGDSIILVIDSSDKIIWSNEDRISTYGNYVKRIENGTIKPIECNTEGLFTLDPSGKNDDGTFFMAQVPGAYFYIPSEKGKKPDFGAIAMYECLGHNGKMKVEEDVIPGFVEKEMTAVAYSDGVSDVFNPHLEPEMIKRLMTDPLNELVGHFTERWHMPHFGVGGPIEGINFPDGPAQGGKADDIFITRIRPRNERVTCKETSEDISKDTGECVCKACRN